MAERLADGLRAVGAELPAGHFVCPICLKLRRVSAGTVSHFPAQTVRVQGARGTTVACEPCNSTIGGTYEALAIDRLNGISHGSIGFADTGSLKIRARQAPDDDGRTVVNIIGGKKGKPGRLSNAVEALRAQSSNPDLMKFDFGRPGTESLKRALTWWAFLAWSDYAGYAYTSSVGASLVRPIVLVPRTPLPNALFVSYGELSGPPMPIAAPILLARVTKPEIQSFDEVDEFIGLGVQWQSFFIALPFANDNTGRVWRRLEELLETGALDREVRRVRLRSLMTNGMFDPKMPADVVLGWHGERSVVCDKLDEALANALIAGSPFARDPDRKGWKADHVIDGGVDIQAGEDSRYRP